MNTFKKSALVLCAAIVTLSVFPTFVLAQTATEIAGNVAPALKEATAKGARMQVVSNVSDAANIQAVLIPASVAKRIFGKEVSQNYAVIEVIISNRDPRASLVVHSLFMDDSQWLLRGGGGGCASKTIPAGKVSNQSVTQLCQVASIESRLVRGEALDAQQWTKRNWTLRSLTALGSIGAGFEFPFSPDVVKGISVFNGILLPAAGNLWPDGTISQINRISDFGFQTNKIIAKQSADIMIAFFPIDRFLTGSFKKLFLKDPSALFVPAEMLADPKESGKLLDILQPLTNVLFSQSDQNKDQNTKDTEQTKAAREQDRSKVAGNLLKSMILDCTDPKHPSDAQADLLTGGPGYPQMCAAQKLLGGLSLNTVRVVVGGVMTVDVATVPATVYSFDLDTDLDKLWTQSITEQTGTIGGVYLTGGIPSVVDENGKPLKGVTITAIPEGSNDTQLKFKLTVADCIKSPGKAFLVVSKTPDPVSEGSATDMSKMTGAAVASTPFQIAPQPAACLTKADPKAGAAAATTPGAPAVDPVANPAAPVASLAAPAALSAAPAAKKHKSAEAPK